MNRIVSIGMFVVCIGTSIQTLAMSQLDKAYGLFQQRSHIENVRAAKEIYASIIKDSHANLIDRQEAMTRYGRLVLWEGAVAKSTFKIGEKDAAKLFKTCMELTENLSPKNIKKEIAEYAYWRATCIGLWAANLSPAKAAIHLKKIKEIKELVTLGMNKFRSFDGYGFARIKAGMMFKSKALSILDLYHPDQALVLINEVISNGTDIYMTYVLKAEILDTLGRRKEAIETLQAGMESLSERFTQNTIPQDLVFENMIFMQNMSTLKANLGG